MPRTNNILNTLRILAFTLAAFALLGISVAEAARVSRTKGRLVEIELAGGDNFVKGDRAKVTANGKTVGILVIQQIKGTKALTRLEKGRAPRGATVALAASRSGTKAKAKSEPSSGSSDFIVGALAGFGLDTQSVKATSANGATTESVSMSGNGFSAKVYADMSLGEELGVIGRFGMETFKVTGTSKNALCSSSTACETSITYISGDLLFRYNFAPGTWNPFAAAGLGIYFPMSKKTNILDETKIASTTIFLLGGGINWSIGNFYVPLSVEYGLFPPSNQVTTNFIALRGGIGWNW